MYVCFKCWRAEVNFEHPIFFRVLDEIFSIYFSTRDECRKCREIRQVSRKIVGKNTLKISTTQQSKLPGQNSSLHANIQNRRTQRVIFARILDIFRHIFRSSLHSGRKICRKCLECRDKSR